MGHEMQWPDLKAKFLSLAQPVIGPRAIELFDVLRDFDQPGRLREAFSILDSRALSEAPAAAASLVAQEERFDGSC
jgi:hypothetical protein